LWVTFWVSLTVAGLLGFAFSEFIGRRIRAMSEAAAAIAAGDFDQRLPTGLVPDEVYDLAASYNSMAERLGEAFGAIQESERQIAAVVESMAEGVAAFDSAGEVRVINPEAALLLDLPHEELTGAQLRDLTDEPEVLAVVNAGLSGERVARTVTLGRYTVQLHCTPLRDAQGEVDGAVLLLADVTEQRRIEEAQRRFVADASHEMRTPVAALKGILELLADGAQEDPEVRDDFIRTMQVEADRLGRLVSDLLTLAQLDAGSLKLRPSPQRATDLLGDVSTIMHALAEAAGVVISVEVPDDELCVRADRDRVVQVLLSLTDNALKHSPRESRIRLGAVRTGERVLLQVADEGRGIAPEDLPRLFERFYRADTARSGGGGAGLGLAIAKEIVEAHGSTIVVHSQPGVGTTFGFELPVADEGSSES
jgi:PAS domain S-box-containing protein